MWWPLLPSWIGSILRFMRFTWRPFGLHKTAGGDTLIWVGFELLLRSPSIGISERRAEWFARWTEKIASSATVHMASFEEGLGRIMFVAGALEHEAALPGSTLQISYYASQGLGAEGTIVRRVYTPLLVLRDPSRTVTIYAEQGILQQNAFQGWMHRRARRERE